MAPLEWRTVTVTADDIGPELNMAAWIMMVLMCLATALRLGNKYFVARVGADDVLAIVAALVAVAQTVAVNVQVSSGLGRRQASLSDGQIEGFEKAGYASQMLYILVLCLVKLSCSVYIMTATPKAEHRTVSKVLSTLVILWGVTAMFGLAFQCSLPRPWAFVSGQCFNLAAFWDAVGALDIATDLALTGLWMYIIVPLQMPLDRKLPLLLAFCSRALIVPIVILRLKYLSSAIDSSDQTFDYFNAAILTQVGMNLSLFATSVPCLKVFMRGLESGLLVSDLRPRSELGKKQTSRKRMDNTSQPWSGQSGQSGHSGKKAAAGVELQMGKQMRPKTDNLSHHVSVTTRKGTNREGREEEDSESRISVSSEKMIIKRTVSWTVDTDERQTSGQRGSEGGQKDADGEDEHVEG